MKCQIEGKRIERKENIENGTEIKWNISPIFAKQTIQVVWSPRYKIISVVDALNYSSIVNGMVFLACLSWFSIIILNTVSLFIFLLDSYKLLNCMLIYRTFRRKVKYKSQNDGKSLRIRWVSPFVLGPIDRRCQAASPCSTLCKVRVSNP